MKNTKIVEWVLRIAIAGEFIGHGMFALNLKQGWFHYFTDLGISVDQVPTLLILIGIMDLVVALIVLIRPIRIVLLWAILWATWTALLRPVTGDPIWDLVERFANIGAPLALLAFYGFPNNLRTWFK